MVQCPNCKKVIVDNATDGGIRIRSRMLHIRNGIATAVCPECKTSVPVPLAFTGAESKANKQAKPKLVVHR